MYSHTMLSKLDNNSRYVSCSLKILRGSLGMPGFSLRLFCHIKLLLLSIRLAVMQHSARVTGKNDRYFL